MEEKVVVVENEVKEEKEDPTILRVGNKVFDIGVIADSIVAIDTATGKVVEYWKMWPEDWEIELENMRKYLIEKYSSQSQSQ